jgi:hypothetical protein
VNLPDRTQLTEALAWWVDVVADVQTDTFTLTMSRTMARRTLSALERLLDFPTDEQVEAAAKAIAIQEGIVAAVWDNPRWKGDRAPQLLKARAALEAVRP